MLSAANKELLTDAGMASARAAIANARRWFVHVTSYDSVSEITRVGLRPTNPGLASGSPVEVDEDVAAAIGIGADEILCLMPMPSQDTRPKRDIPQVAMAVDGSDLPMRIGVDWSYGGCLTLVDVLVRESPTSPLPSIFVEVALRRGSIVSYDIIPATAVRVRTKGAPANDPSQWPLLSDANPADLEILG